MSPRHSVHGNIKCCCALTAPMPAPKPRQILPHTTDVTRQRLRLSSCLSFALWSGQDNVEGYSRLKA